MNNYTQTIAHALLKTEKKKNMTKLTELYIKLTQVLKMKLYLKKENDKLTEQIRKEKLKEKNGQ